MARKRNDIVAAELRALRRLASGLNMEIVMSPINSPVVDKRIANLGIPIFSARTKMLRQIRTRIGNNRDGKSIFISNAIAAHIKIRGGR